MIQFDSYFFQMGWLKPPTRSGVYGKMPWSHHGEAMNKERSLPTIRLGEVVKASIFFRGSVGRMVGPCFFLVEKTVRFRLVTDPVHIPWFWDCQCFVSNGRLRPPKRNNFPQKAERAVVSRGFHCFGEYLLAQTHWNPYCWWTKSCTTWDG